ncbi:MAG: DNA glycosylase AlkZ-like family protein [Eubacteriales bacterium]
MKNDHSDTVAVSRCGLSCTDCTYREPCHCGGCIETMGHPFHGVCPVAVCCQEKGLEHCGQCPDLPCRLLSDYSCDAEHGDNPPGARIEVCRRWRNNGAKPLIPHEKILSLRMERQNLYHPVSGDAYDELFCDLQPGQNEYWHGFGCPPLLSYRASFDDTEYNRARQADRRLLKLRLAGGNIGWVLREDLELFYTLYRKPLGTLTRRQEEILALIRREGPMTIRQIKEETGMQVKQITPVLHRLQEAFLVYEDQNDGEWDRGWYDFAEMFPDSALFTMCRHDALKIILRRFTYRMVLTEPAAAKSYYRLPEKEIRAACDALCAEGVFTERNGGYLLVRDAAYLETHEAVPPRTVLALHRNDFLVRAAASVIEARFKPKYDALPYDHEPLQFVLVDGELRAAAVGHFRYGPYEIHDIVCDGDLRNRREEIMNAVLRVNPGAVIQRFDGELCQ